MSQCRSGHHPPRPARADLQQLNNRFVAWAESYLNCRLHSETDQTPIGRFQAQGPPRAADPQLLQEAFRWS